MKYTERRPKDTKEFRKLVMDAALVIAASEGWKAVTIPHIADIIEYMPSIVDEHFKNMEDLFDELRLTGHRNLCAVYDLAIRSEPDPKKALLMLSEKHWDFAFKNKQLYQLMFNVDKPVQNTEMEKIIIREKQLFFALTKDMELAGELLFNWVCLLNGFTFSIMQMKFFPKISEIHPKKLFVNTIKRFLKEI
jgi:AcrR family transcriptional regulator